MAVQKPEMFGKQTEREMGASHPARTAPLWTNKCENKVMIQWYAKIRSKWFVLYSFGGGYWHGGDRIDGTRSRFSGDPEYCTKQECAEQIVILSKWMLHRMENMGRVPIAGNNTNKFTGVWTPKCGAEWVARMKHQYSLYLTVEDLYNATDHIVAGREINEDDIQVKELTAG